jgi:hypothetical protein
MLLDLMLLLLPVVVVMEMRVDKMDSRLEDRKKELAVGNREDTRARMNKSGSVDGLAMIRLIHSAPR